VLRITLDWVERMPNQIVEQKEEIAEALARQQREHDEFLKHRVENEVKQQLAQDVLKAARQAAQKANTDRDEEREAQLGSWRIMWTALAIAGAVLLFLKLRFH
jgi:anti-sigma-K factor RskA